MTYTIKISETNSELAKNLLFYLKSLAETEEYNFLQIIDSDEGFLSKELKDELDFRYEHFLQNHEEFSDWDDVKHKYLN